MKLALALPLVLVLVAAAAPALANPHINVIASETTSTSPLRVKTTFTVENVGYTACCYGAAFYVMSSGVGPTVHFYGAEGNADFTGYNPNADYVSFEINSMAAYAGVHAFAIVTDQSVPCVDLTFWDPILGKTPTTNSDYVVRGCLAVDMPTPASPSSWGSVKATYR